MAIWQQRIELISDFWEFNELWTAVDLEDVLLLLETDKYYCDDSLFAILSSATTYAIIQACTEDIKLYFKERIVNLSWSLLDKKSKFKKKKQVEELLEQLERV